MSGEEMAGGEHLMTIYRRCHHCKAESSDGAVIEIPSAFDMPGETVWLCSSCIRRWHLLLKHMEEIE